MCKLKLQLDCRSIEIIYATFIRLILEYGNKIWDNCTHNEKEEIEKIKMRTFVRRICDRTHFRMLLFYFKPK